VPVRQLLVSLSLFLLIALPACRAAPGVSVGATPSPLIVIPANTQTVPAAKETNVIQEPFRTSTTSENAGNVANPTLSAPPLSTPTEKPEIPTSTLITSENASDLAEITRHDFSPWDQILAIRWSPDGQSLAVAAGDAIYILDAFTLTEKARLEPGVATPGLDFSPDGMLLAAGGRDGMLHIWDMDTGQEIQDFEAHQKSISSLAFSPDGNTLASAGYDAVARLWDIESLDNLSEMIGGTFAIPAIAFTPDGANLGIVNGNVIRLRDVATSRFVISIIGERPYYSIAISPDGKFLASGDVNNAVSIWDLTAPPGPGGEIRSSLLTLSGHSGRQNSPQALVWQVTYSPDGSLLASAGGDATLRLWSVGDGEMLAVLTGHSKAVTSVAFSPDGRWLATGGLDGKIILWGVGAAQPAD
jgi:WD40 repeat protein